MSDRENNRIQIFDTNGKLLKTWNHLGSTQGIWISPKDEMYILTHRNNVENITADTLAGPADEDRSGKREGARLDGIAGSLGERIAERRHLRGEFDGECAALDAAPGVHALSLTQ